MKIHKKSIILASIGFIILATILSLFSFCNYSLIKNIFQNSEDNKFYYTVNADECTHNYDKWQIVTNPSTTSLGEISRKCTICRHLDTNTLPMLEENIYSHHTNIYPTCTTMGEEIYSTNVFKQNFDVSVSIPALGHQPADNYTTTLEPTCIDNGLKVLKCLRCDYLFDKIQLPATGHNYSSEYTIDKYPSCEDYGVKSHHCLSCNDITDSTNISPFGHKISGIVISNYPTKTKYKEGDTFNPSGLKVEAICSRSNCKSFGLADSDYTLDKTILTQLDTCVVLTANINGIKYTLDIPIIVEKYRIYLDSNAIFSFNGYYDGKVHSFGIDQSRVHTENNESINIYCSFNQVAWSKDMFYQARNATKQTIYWKICAKDCEDLVGSIPFEIKKAQAQISVPSQNIEYIFGQNVAMPKATTNFGEIHADKIINSTTPAGIYTITYSVEDTANYYGDSKEIEIIIRAKTLSTNYIGSSNYTNKIQGEVDAKDGFDPTATVVISAIDISAEQISLDLPKNKVISNSYNATIYINNTPTTPKDEVTIKFEKPKNITTNTCIILINENGKTVQKLGYVEEDYIVFSTTALGDFVIIADKPESNLDKILAIVVVPMVVAFAITLIIAIVKLKKPSTKRLKQEEN